MTPVLNFSALAWGTYGFRFLEEWNLAKECEICGKKPVYGNNISHAHNTTRRRWEPNLQKVRALVEGVPKKIRVCTRCLRSGKVIKNVRSPRTPVST